MRNNSHPADWTSFCSIPYCVPHLYTLQIKKKKKKKPTKNYVISMTGEVSFLRAKIAIKYKAAAACYLIAITISFL